MLKDWTPGTGKEVPEGKKRLKARRLDLAGLQQQIRQAKLPVIVLVEGWGAAGKGGAFG